MRLKTGTHAAFAISRLPALRPFAAEQVESPYAGRNGRRGASTYRRISAGCPADAYGAKGLTGFSPTSEGWSGSTPGACGKAFGGRLPGFDYPQLHARTTPHRLSCPAVWKANLVSIKAQLDAELAHYKPRNFKDWLEIATPEDRDVVLAYIHGGTIPANMLANTLKRAGVPCTRETIVNMRETR